MMIREDRNGPEMGRSRFGLSGALGACERGAKPLSDASGHGEQQA